ncbi:mitochondrial import receptor subunit tom20 [Teratosphaeriaceae sp. CCFEE 6253]|nr:mitochondrial import receptor subunit tom20 [Teratosphaeriaceae sp. CCFEE 6253]
MASTTPSSFPSTSTILITATTLLTTAGVAYALYFDHQRRTSPAFRRELKKQHKKAHKSLEEEAAAASQDQKERIRRVIAEALEEGFPKDPEETEGYFMQEVARGEGMCTDGSDTVDAALCFFRALKVYPQQSELIDIYNKTVPKRPTPMAQATPSPLFTLPLELREMVYDHVFTQVVYISTSNRPGGPSLLGTSKEIRREALPRYYASSLFCADGLPHVCGFLRRKSPRLCQAVTSKKVSMRGMRVDYLRTPEDRARESARFSRVLELNGVKLRGGVLQVYTTGLLSR